MYQIFKLVSPEATRTIDRSDYYSKIVDRFSLESVFTQNSFETKEEAEKELEDEKYRYKGEFVILNIIPPR